MVDILKIGGNQLDDPAFIAGLAVRVKHLTQQGQFPVIVHGGGKAIKRLQEKFSIQPRYIGGLRVTDEETMQLVAMALIGSANVNLVAALIAAGVDAQGFNGADRGLLRSVPLSHPDGDLERVGKITNVRAEVIHGALANGVVPVIAPVALAEDGGFHNVNADQAAGAVAAALGAERVVFLTDVPGVLKGSGESKTTIATITRAGAEGLIREGTVKDGMAVKLGAALDSLSAGVKQALITNLDGFAQNSGTVVTIE